jgi:hypothetical protein
MRSPIVLTILGFALWGTASVGLGQSTGEACSSCHDDLGKKVAASAHADLGCSSCHEKHEAYPHPAGVPKPKCSQCHSDVAEQYSRSAHGEAVRKGNAAAPDCTVCHVSAHEAKLTTSAEFRKGIPDTCGMCHTDIADQFRAGVHGQAVAKGITAAPVCTTCHGEHSILAKSNGASPVNAAHIRETCGQCHVNGTAKEKNYTGKTFSSPNGFTTDKDLKDFFNVTGAAYVWASPAAPEPTIPSSDTKYYPDGHNKSMNHSYYNEWILTGHARSLRWSDGTLWSSHARDECLGCHSGEGFLKRIGYGANEPNDVSIFPSSERRT